LAHLSKYKGLQSGKKSVNWFLNKRDINVQTTKLYRSLATEQKIFHKRNSACLKSLKNIIVRQKIMLTARCLVCSEPSCWRTISLPEAKQIMQNMHHFLETWMSSD